VMMSFNDDDDLKTGESRGRSVREEMTRCFHNGGA